MPEKKSEKQAKAPAFEEGLDQLEKIVKQLEDGDLPLEKSLELFERGVRLSEACRKQLQEAEGIHESPRHDLASPFVNLFGSLLI